MKAEPLRAWLAIAVVEAMYDAAALDACMRVFHEKGFHMDHKAAAAPAR